MTAQILDTGILVLIILSALIGLIRGLVREALSLVTWGAAFILSALFVKRLAAVLPFAVQSEVVRLGIAFGIIFFGVLVIGAIINHLISSGIASIGLGKVDHVLGGVFGILRGALIISLLVMLMGLSAYPKQAWWKDSVTMPYFENLAATIKGYIPEHFASYLEKPTSDAAKTSDNQPPTSEAPPAN